MQVLEFASVARITEDPKYREKAEKGLRAVHAANKNVRVHEGAGEGPRVARGGARGPLVLLPCSPRVVAAQPPLQHSLARPVSPLDLLPPCPALVQALLFESVDRRSGVESGYTRGVGAGTDSYYEYLIKVGGLDQGSVQCAPCWRQGDGPSRKPSPATHLTAHGARVQPRRSGCTVAWVGQLQPAGTANRGPASRRAWHRPMLACCMRVWCSALRMRTQPSPRSSLSSTGCWAAGRTSTSARAGSRPRTRRWRS